MGVNSQELSHLHRFVVSFSKVTRFASSALIPAVFALLASGVGGAATLQPPPDLAAAVAAVQRGDCADQLPALRSLSDRPGPPGARAGYLLAHCLEQTGQLVEAQAGFDTVAGQYPPLAPYARFRAALLAVRADAAADAASRFGDLLAKAPTRPLARRARLPYAEALIKAGRSAEAVKMLRDLLRTSAEDETLAHAWWLLGTAAEGAGDPAQAVQAYTMAWWAIPNNRYAADAADRLKALSGGYLPEPPPDARVERAKRLAALTAASDAEGELVKALHQTPPPRIAAEAWYQLGFVRLSSKGGVYAFEQALRYPENATRALYWLAEAFGAIGRPADAKATWWRVSRERPTSSWAARALYALALSAEGAHAWGEADRILGELARRFPGWWLGDEARWRRGWLRYRLGRYAEAEAVFLAAVQAAPGSARAAEALYWASKAREQVGRDPRALLRQVAQRYPLTFVGQRARLRLAAPPPPRIPAPGPVLARDDRVYPPHEELALLGFAAEAAEEAEVLLDASPTLETRRSVALLRALAGDVPGSVGTAEAVTWTALHGGGTADVELWALAYPRAYWDQVNPIAAAAGVDPYLLLAVMREESRYNPRAVSPAGAVGLMQLMPFTARALAEGEDVTVEKLMQAEISIRYGATYLGGVLKEFGGEVTLALAAYNAGPVAARRWRRFPGNDPDLFIANIPYAETRAYVQRVLETYGIYQWLYP